MTVSLASDDRRRTSPGRARGRNWRPDAAWYGRLEAVTAVVSTINDAEVRLPDDPGASMTHASEAVSTLMRVCSDAQSSACSGDDGRRGEQIGAAVAELQQLATEMLLGQMSQWTARMSDCAAALHALRGASTLDELSDRLCADAARGCGFSRVVLSRVDHDHWAPWKAYLEGADVHSSWFAEWTGRAIPIEPDTPERRSVTASRPTMVVDTSRDRVFRPIIVESGRSRGYVVSPVNVGGSTAGLLHADHSSDGATITSDDRDVLWAFSVGVGYVLERVQLVDQVRRHHDSLKELLDDAAVRIDELCDSGIRLTSTVSDRADADGQPVTSPAKFDRLTLRERDVVRLMISGASNAEIADRLIIAPGTVKSHVKQILRKLGMCNRSQVIAAAAAADW